MKLERSLSLSITILFISITLLYAEDPIKYSYLNEEQTHVKAVFTLDFPKEEIWDFFTDYSKHPDVLPNINKVTVLKSKPGEKLTETVVQAGPFEMKYKSKVTEDKSNYYMRWDQTEGPFKKFTGSYQLEPVNANQTRIIYTIYIDHPLMPDAVKQSLIKGSIPDMRKALIKYFSS
jgi:ribosome-associated toxin RatA of RatAB toxin-antitoxin module